MLLVQSGKSQGSGDSVPRLLRRTCVAYGPEIAVSCRVALRMLMRRPALIVGDPVEVALVESIPARFRAPLSVLYRCPALVSLPCIRDGLPKAKPGLRLGWVAHRGEQSQSSLRSSR